MTQADDPVELAVRVRSDAAATQTLWAHALCLHRACPNVPLLPALPGDLGLLPPALAARSASPVEIVLGYDDAVVALNVLEEIDVQVLGWEGWVVGPNGEKGHAEAPQGTVDLSGLSIAEGFNVCRTTMRNEIEAWASSAAIRNGQLYFCISVRAA